VQSYYGQEEHQVPLSFSVGGLAGSLPQIFSYLQNLGIPSALSYPPFVRSVGNARKTVLPTKKLKKSFTKGKRIGTLKTKDYASKKNDYRTREESGYQPLFQLSQDWKRKRHEKAVLRL
jgi:hypothetical protein